MIVPVELVFVDFDDTIVDGLGADTVLGGAGADTITQQALPTAVGTTDTSSPTRNATCPR